MTDKAWCSTMEEESMDQDSADLATPTPSPVRPPEREEEEETEETRRFRPRTPDSSDAPGRDATATPDPPPDPRPRQPRRAPRHPRPPDKPFYTRHRNVVAVLTVTSAGFTLCNGVESLSNDTVPVSGATLARYVHEMSVKKLYVTDHYTRRKWIEVQRKHPRLFPFLDLVPMNPPAQRQSCCYCGKYLCHRWCAVKLGYNRIAKCSIDPIRH